MADPTEPWCDHGDWKHRGPCYVRRDDNRPSKRMYMEPWPPVFLPEGRPLGPATSADLLELAQRVSEVGGHPTHIAINPANVDAARAAGLEVEYMPATSEDLLELDAVPEPVDSAAPVATHLPGCAPIGPSAETRPYRRPA